MTRRRCLAAIVALLAVLQGAVSRADDYGPGRDIAQVRGDAKRLLAQRVRAAGVDPSKTVVSEVVVIKDQALLSWSAGSQRGVMGLARTLDRWWDAFDEWPVDPDGNYEYEAAFPLTPSSSSGCPSPPFDLARTGLAANLIERAASFLPPLPSTPPPSKGAFVKPRCEDDIYDATIVLARGGEMRPDRPEASGYAVRLQYAQNDAHATSHFTQFSVRAPERGEMLPSPTPPHDWGGSNGVFFLGFEISGSAPVHFRSGSTLDVWFPFVLDDQLSYPLSIASASMSLTPIPAKPFDNALHFVLPEFTVKPGEEVFAEIDGTF